MGPPPKRLKNDPSPSKANRKVKKKVLAEVTGAKPQVLRAKKTSASVAFEKQLLKRAKAMAEKNGAPPSSATSVTAGKKSASEVSRLHQDEGVMHLLHGLSSTRRKTQVTPFNASASNSIVAGVGSSPASSQSSLIAPNARSSHAKVTARPQSLLATPNIDIPPPSPRSTGGKTGNNLLKVAEMSLDKTLEILKDFPRQEVIDLWESSNKSGQKSGGSGKGESGGAKVSADILATLMATMREGPGKASCSPNSGEIFG